MTQNDFHKLVHLVMDSKAKPPENLFAGGMDNWRARARLAHFLAMDEIDKKDEADELFHSVVEADYNEEISEEVEEYAFALQKLSALEKEQGKFDEALSHINTAIEAAEGTDFLYKYILRGDLLWLPLQSPAGRRPRCNARGQRLYAHGHSRYGDSRKLSGRSRKSLCR